MGKVSYNTIENQADDLLERQSAEIERLQHLVSNQQHTIDSLLDSIQDLVFYKDLDGTYLGCNQAFSDYVGHSKEQIIGRTDYDLFSPEVAEFFRCQDDLMLTTGRFRRNEEAITYPNGRRVLLDMAKSPLIGQENQIIGLIGVGRDITVNKNLLQRIERERQLFDRGPVAVFLWGTGDGWPIEYVSHNVKEILGYSSTELCAEPVFFSKLIHPEDFDRIYNEVIACLNQGVPFYEQSYRLLHKDGKYRWFYDYTVPERDDDGNLLRLRGYIFDQTQLKQLESELKHERRRLSDMLEATDIRTWEWHVPSDEVRYAGGNFRMSELITLSDAPFHMKSWFELVHPDDVAAARAVLNRHMQGEIPFFECEYRVRDKDGNWRWMISRGKTTDWDIEDHALLVCGTLSDITIKKQAEECIKQTEKLSAIGQLAGGVAHDFNNQLMIMSGYLETIDRSRLSHSVLNALDIVAASIRHSKHLIKQLLVFSKESRYQSQLINMDHLLNDIVGVLRHTLAKNIHIAYISKQRDVRCTIDAGLIENALINLCINARDAMKKGGSLRIILDLETISIPAKTLISVLEPGDYATIRVVDTGCGMDRQTLDHIFEPFFTTKESGTGLGLSTVYGTVNLHQGGIHVTSQPGAGTEFKIYLPVSTAPVGPALSDAAVSASGETPLTILIVDDEPLICNILDTYLTDQGHHIETFSDPSEALAYYRESYANVDLVILDVVMPRLNGFDLLEEMIHINSEVDAMFLSGYSDDQPMPLHLYRHVKAFLEKPIHLKELMNRLSMMT